MCMPISQLAYLDPNDFDSKNSSRNSPCLHKKSSNPTNTKISKNHQPNIVKVDARMTLYPKTVM